MYDRERPEGRREKVFVCACVCVCACERQRDREHKHTCNVHVWLNLEAIQKKLTQVIPGIGITVEFNTFLCEFVFPSILK